MLMTTIKSLKVQSFCFLLLLFLAPHSFAIKIYHVGSKKDIKPPTIPIVCLAGGGEDDYWAEGWKEMIKRANGGDVVIIRADDDREEYESWVFNDTAHHGFKKVNSVSTLVIESKEDASNARAVSIVDNAEMIFFAGGDQYKYYSSINGTKLGKALTKALKKRKIPFAGTSAGMAILGGIDYTAKSNFENLNSSNVTAADAMLNPTGQLITLDRSFLTPYFMENVVTDTHFSQRDRQGRLLGFMARAVYNNFGKINATNVKGIGSDEGTAVCINDNGTAKVYGNNSVHFLIGNAEVERLKPGASLNWFANKKAVKVYSISGAHFANAEFNFKTWSGVGGISKYWYVDGSVKDKPTFGEVVSRSKK